MMKHNWKNMLCMLSRNKNYIMTIPGVRFFHAKHLRVSKMYPGPQLQAHATEPKTKTSAKEKGQLETKCRSQKLMLKHRLIQAGAAGTFSTLPLMTRSLEKLEKVIDQEMQNIGAQKITMPCLAPSSIWKQSNRWDVMGAELLKLQDRQEKDLCLAPTHEEAVTSIVASDLGLTQSKLPVKLYQIGRKFRDEMRPKHGLLRTREFEMKDLYTFDVGLKEASETYEEVCEAYDTIFQRLGLKTLKVEADTGAMGGSQSHEFHLRSPIGEDTLLECPKCGKCVNDELGENTGYSKNCPEMNCSQTLEKVPGIEIAHAFILGTKYSKIFNARFMNLDKESFSNYHMGCFGIGISRLLAAGLDVLSSEESLRWPSLLPPHQICVISQQTGYFFEESKAMAESIQNELLSKPHLENEVILDDRYKLSIGKRINYCKQIGFPHLVIVGKKAQQEPPLLEYQDVNDGSTQLLSREQLVDKLMQIKTVVL